MTVVWEGPSPWPVGGCGGCVRPVHPFAQVVVVAEERGLVGRMFHRDCWRAADHTERNDER